MSFFEDLKLKYTKLNTADKLIVITVVIYIVQLLFESSFGNVFSYFRLNGSITATLYKPWSIVTYAFLHSPVNPIHILLNMVVLHFIGGYFINIFNKDKFIATYILGIVFGAVFFLLGSLFHPVLSSQVTYVVGASAALRALIFFLIGYNPNMEIMLFTKRIPLKYIGILVVVLDILMLLDKTNPGGGFAHLGGIFIGYLYATQIKTGNDFGAVIANGWKKLTTRKQKSPLRTVHKTKTTQRKEHKTVYQKNREKQEKIDAILDKIKESGYESLSKSEKQFLFEVGKED